MKFFMQNDFLICISLTRVFIINWTQIFHPFKKHAHVIFSTCHVCDDTRQHSSPFWHARFSFKKKINFFFWLIWLIPTTNLSFIFIFFYLHHVWKNRNVKQKQEQKLAITNDYFGQGWEKIVGDLSRMCGKLYVCTHRFGVCFVLQINKVVAIRWLQSQSPPKVMTSVYVIGWKLFIILAFSSCI